MDTEHQVPIWFFVGGTLLIYGIIILAAGLYGLIYPGREAEQALAWLHPGIWWGGVMTVIGAFYCMRFHPWRKKK